MFQRMPARQTDQKDWRLDPKLVALAVERIVCGARALGWFFLGLLNHPRHLFYRRNRSRAGESSVSAADDLSQEGRAENTIRKEIYDGRYNKTIATAKFSDFVDEQFLPWAKGNKLSYADDERRCKVLKDVFGNQPMRDITPLQIERFKMSLVGKKTYRGTTRSGATVNRYLSLLS